MNISLDIKHFEQLSAKELHAILHLRVSVFILEQDCVYPEIDGLDVFCYHVLLRNLSNEIIGTARIIPSGKIFNEIAIGRIAIIPEERKKGYGRILVSETIEFIQNELNENAIRIAALKYLEHFYQSLGFVSIREYREFDYDYVEMLKG